MALPSISSFYTVHPALKDRAEKEPSFDQFVNSNLESIQSVFDNSKKLALSLKRPDQTRMGKITLNGPVFTIIQVPYYLKIPNYSPMKAYGVCQGNHPNTLPFSNEEDYKKRVDELAEKIERSLETFFSTLPCNELEKHITLAVEGMMMCFYDAALASWASALYFNTIAVEPDEVRIKLTTTDAVDELSDATEPLGLSAP